MNTLIIIIVLAIIGGIIGWITNILAIKLIFRPINPIKIPIINIEILGLIPKRKKEIAENIGQVVANELVSIDDIIHDAFTEEDKAKLTTYVQDKIKNIINEKLNFIPAPFKMIITPKIDSIIDEEVSPAINELRDDMISKIKDRVEIETIVTEKINDLDLLELERIIISVAKKELKHIEILGLILGLVIGLFQGIIISLI
ncbi:DUF445 family protein [Clostridium bornimense]|uniref:DUF445 domain-containing protein n=1 Tax=Clostridium bornimense TaxID=1216932 RepID=UPI001C10302B|nr:DUF445 family protein [Clostridium bornimense]MBU5317200.1 DUF445 family protein [Clostridium bornimense]